VVRHVRGDTRRGRSPAIIAATMGDPQYAKERLAEAVAVLATNRDAIRSRLWKAASHVLAAGEHIPDALRAYYDELTHELTRCDPRRDEGRIAATVGRVRLARCEHIAGRIVDMADHLRVYVDEQRRKR
jgi:hypothetical protein